MRILRACLCFHELPALHRAMLDERTGKEKLGLELRQVVVVSVGQSRSKAAATRHIVSLRFQ